MIPLLMNKDSAPAAPEGGCHKHGHHHSHHRHDVCCADHREHHPHAEHSECDCTHHHHDTHGEHRHHHEHGEDCGCHHHHPHQHAAHHPDNAPGGRTAVYTLENLGCPNCAAKMEFDLQKLPGIDDAVITFANKQLRLTAADPDALLSRVQQICQSIEPEVIVRPASRHSHTPEHQHHHAARSAMPEWVELLTGGALFAGGLTLGITDQPLLWQLALILPAYLLLGGGILLKALGNIRRGQIFDENLLMSLATLGAFVIGEYPEAVGVMLFYRIGEYFQDKAVARSRSQIMQAVDMRPETVIRLIDGSEQTIPAEEARPGDLLLVRPGNRIPLDSTVISGESLLDTSAVTGEPVPRPIRPGDSIFSGCLNTDGLLTVRVDKPLSESMVSRILESVENAAANKPRIDKFITRFARIYTPLVVLAAAAVAAIPPLFDGDFSYWMKTALTFLVISCPCALVLSIPLAFFAGIGAASQAGILFKGGAVIEALAGVKAVLLDKTGTLTCGSFSLQQISPAADTDAQELLRTAAACEASSNHPIAISIIAACREQGITYTPAAAAQEIAGRGIRADLPQGEALCGSRRLLEDNGVTVPARIAATGGAEVYVALAGRYLGCISIADELKPDSPEAITSMHAAGLQTIMLTGDNSTAAQAVSQKLGLDACHAELLPQEKLTLMQQHRADLGAVLYVGDGINDAPVLAGADVGAAMGQGADAAIEAADVVFMNSNLSALPQAVAIARATCRIARQNVWLALGIKLLVMLLGLLHMANLWLAVFADTGVALLCMLNALRLLYRR